MEYEGNNKPHCTKETVLILKPNVSIHFYLLSYSFILSFNFPFKNGMRRRGESFWDTALLLVFIHREPG